MIQNDQTQRTPAICDLGFGRKVLQPENLPYLSLVFGRSAEDHPSITDVRQNVTDLMLGLPVRLFVSERFILSFPVQPWVPGEGLDVALQQDDNHQMPTTSPHGSADLVQDLRPKS